MAMTELQKKVVEAQGTVGQVMHRVLMAIDMADESSPGGDGLTPEEEQDGANAVVAFKSSVDHFDQWATAVIERLES